MDVKFKKQICNCAPSKIEGYGKYIWTAGSLDKLQNIPRLPDELFKLINSPTKAKQNQAEQHQQQQQLQHQATHQQ
jgi:hypothetical protein